MINTNNLINKKILVPQETDIFPKDFISSILNNFQTFSDDSYILTLLMRYIFKNEKEYKWINDNDPIYNINNVNYLKGYIIKLIDSQEKPVFVFSNQMTEVDIDPLSNLLYYINIPTLYSQDESSVITHSIQHVELVSDDISSIKTALDQNDMNQVYSITNNIITNNLSINAGELFFPIILNCTDGTNNISINYRENLNDYIHYIKNTSEYIVKINVNMPIVKIYDSNNTLIDPVENGIYNLSSGSYSYEISMVNHQSQTGAFVVSGENQEININLLLN